MNLPALCALGTLIRRPSLLAPQLIASGTASTTPFAQLRGRGIKAVLFDKDNTLALPHECQLHEDGRLALRNALEFFPLAALAVVSNTAGSSDDRPQFALAEEVERNFGVSVVRHGTKVCLNEPSWRRRAHR